MIYKRYELSLSQNGPDLVHIARNAMGNVVFREASEDKLKKAIDRSIEERRRLEELEAKKRAQKAKTKAKKHEGGLFQAPPPPEPDPGTEEKPATTEESILTPPQQRVTRGPDGKFISKSILEKEEPSKKSFWDKIKT